MTALFRPYSRKSCPSEALVVEDAAVARVAILALLAAAIALAMLAFEPPGSTAAPAAATTPAGRLTAAIASDAASGEERFPVVGDSAGGFGFLVFDWDPADPAGIPGFGPLTESERAHATQRGPHAN